MADRMQLKGRTAIVTGAASGIGRAIAQSLGRRGCHLALADLNEAGLEETAQSCAKGTKITCHRLDVGDRAAIAAFPNVVREAHERVDLLVNNAGVALGGTFEQVSENDFEWLIAINFFGVVRMTRAFLPTLKASDDARIVNISSIFGIIAPPGQTAYCASKFAVRGFSESLRHELKGTHVGVTVVHPGGVATAIARNARAPQSITQEQFRAAVGPVEAQLKLPPAIAAETIVSAVERRQPRVIVGSDAKFATMIERMSPVMHWQWLQRLRPRRAKTPSS
ncbi:MAG: SDR family NAD(P)-dependent oxidoreductase [Methylobacteriaceae bacterium]|nr:SDR family NAD(P)-dependent oxidoreductase [Methylobacteriaceae bacterium]